MPEQTYPQDLKLWARWESSALPADHVMSPRRVTVDGGEWQRWCSCGWRGPLTPTALQARESHAAHLADVHGVTDDLNAIRAVNARANAIRVMRGKE